MAIRLEYETCLFEEALDAGVADYLQVQDKREKQTEERESFEKSEKERQEQLEADGETFEPVVKEWEEIDYKPYLTKKVQFVACLNTMGQDRKFTEEERLFALRTVQSYRDRWEKSEQTNLKSDIEAKIERMVALKDYKEHHEAQDQTELEAKAEAGTAQKEGSEPLSDEMKIVHLKKVRMSNIAKTFYDPEGMIVHQRQVDRDKLRSSAEARVSTPKGGDEAGETVVPTVKYYPLAPEQWKKRFLDLRQLSIIKNPRVLQSLFYFLGYTREQICERNTNSLDFKKAKELINEQLFQKIAAYNPQGQRDGEFKEYQKLSFIKKNLEVEEEKVEEFSLVMVKILRWLLLAIELRVEDIVRRRDAVEMAKQERENCQKLENLRLEKYEKDLAEKKQAFEEQVDADLAKAAEALAAKEVPEGEEPEQPVEAPRPEFDANEFKLEFDTANPEVLIPVKVEDEVDNDFDLPYTAPVAATE